MSFLTEKPFGIAYNFPLEYNALAAELWRRDVPISLVNPSKLALDPQRAELPFGILFNDLSSPAGFEAKNSAVSSLINYNRHIETAISRFPQGRVINGAHSLEILANRVRQLSLLSSLKIAFPRTVVAASLDALVTQVHQLRFPILVKSNNVFSGDHILKFDRLDDLIEAILQERLVDNNDLLLAQEFHAPKGEHLVRVDTLNGKVLSAQKIFTVRDPLLSWEEELNAEPVELSYDIVQIVEEVVRASKVDVASVEYFVDRKTNTPYFYGITPLNYRRSYDQDGAVISAVATYVERRLRKLREVELAL